jgi:hypothetical protein
VNKNYIVLNGKHYDAVTGALIKPVANPSHKTHARLTHTDTTRTSLSRTQLTPHPASITPAKNAQKSAARAQHAAAKPTVHGHKPERPKTLMRHVVAKPTHDKKPHVKQVYPLAKNGSAAITPKLSVNTVNHVRSRRAQEIDKSKHVTKFATPAAVAIPTKIQPIAIKTAPVHTDIKPAPAVHKTPQEKKTDLLEKALANAKSHEETAPAVKGSHHRRRMFSSLAGLAAVLVVVGFVAYANKASVELQVASVRAGFQASLPNYTPTGYERQAAKAADGKVAIGFSSPAQHNAFTLTQESSSWDSQTLFDSIVAQNNTTYQTVQSSGRTIYLYGGDKAAWVDGGILYKVDGNAKLNSDQVISLATSM